MKTPTPTMLYLVLIGILTAVLLLTLFLTARSPARSSKSASMTAQQAILERILMAPPPRYRVVIRPQLAAPKPSPIEGFVRGNHAKPVTSPAPARRQPTSPPSQPPEPTPAADRALAVAQVQPVPHEPVNTTPVNTAPARQQSPIQLSTPRRPQASAELGRQLLGADGKREGNVPLISMDYCATLGWAGYVTGMQKLGGEFFLYNPAQQRIMARADVRNNELTPVADKELRGLSPRVRQIEDEPAIAPLLAKGRKQFNIPDPELILLLPLQADFEIVGGLVRALANRPDTNKPVARVSGVYERADSGVQLHVAQLFDAEGNVQPCDLVLPLRKPVQVSTAE